MFDINRGANDRLIDDMSSGSNNEEVVNLLKDGIRGVQKVQIVESDDGAHDFLLKDLRSSTFNVKIVDSYRDIVMPMIEELQIMDLNNRQVDTRYHLETVLYLSRILETVQEGKEENGGYGESILLATSRFLRRPVWLRLSNAVGLLTKTLTSAAWKTLFGTSKKSTTEEKILKAIQQQTEFFRTGEIREERGFFKSLISGGLIGAPVKALSEAVLKSAFDVSRDNAQLREIQRSNGEAVSNAISSKLSEFLFSGSINRLGRQSGILGGNPYETLTEREYNARNKTEEWEVVEDEVVPLQKDNLRTSNEILEMTRELVVASQASSELAFRNEERDRSFGFQFDAVSDYIKLMFEEMDEQSSYAKDTMQSNKYLVKEAIKARRARWMQNILSFGNLLVNTARGILNSLTTLPAALAGALLGSGIGSGGFLKNGMMKGIGSATLVVGTAYGGFKIGSLIYENFLEGTNAGDFIGEMITRTLAKLGFKDAQEALRAQEAPENQRMLDKMEREQSDLPEILPSGRVGGITEEDLKASEERLKRAEMGNIGFGLYNMFQGNKRVEEARRSHANNVRTFLEQEQLKKESQGNDSVSVLTDVMSGVKETIDNFSVNDTYELILEEAKETNKNLKDLLESYKNALTGEGETTPFPIALDKNSIMSVYRGVN